jgi:hypothetical protein
MSKPDTWPFTTQKEYDQFNSHMKGESRNLKDAAIRAWIEARSQAARQGKETISINGAQTSLPGIHQQKETKL